MLRRLDVLSTEHPACAVFGGPNTTPPGSSRFQTVQGEVLASMLGSGPVRRRYQSFRSGPADDRSLTLCNLAIRRKAMVLFNERLRCAEENAVLAELGRRRAAMHYDAGLTAYHERRASVRTFGAQMYKYGYGRGQLTVREPRTLRATFLPPVLLLAYVLSSFPMTAAFGPAVVVPGILYGFAVMVASTRIGLKVRHAVAAPLAAALFVELHLAYGAGIVVGVAAEWAGRRSTPDPPAERNLTPTPEASWV